jgi:hypothetical protein
MASEVENHAHGVPLRAKPLAPFFGHPFERKKARLTASFLVQKINYQL